jgi:beta-amylase
MLRSVLGLVLVLTACATPRVHVSAMAPLTIGRFDAPDERPEEWAKFAADLAEAKALGIKAISVNLWWGAIEREGDQRFDWRWVDKAFQQILDAGLQLRPVLAFHACGTNVGDACQVPLPPWLDDEALFYRSAQGNLSREAVSVWATPRVLEQYRQLLQAFLTRYASLASKTHGIAIGLGPASELRYPSYNAHDTNAGYPGPGVLQCYSAPARESFRRWTRGLRELPTPEQLDSMFAKGEHHSTEAGRELFDWYRDSLLDHGRQVLSMAAEQIQASPFRGIRITARVPGVHWRVADDRRAELSAGLISTRDQDAPGHGYGPLVALIAELRARPDRPNVALDFTCLEKGNGEGGTVVGSMAEALVFWVAEEAHRRGVPIGGENALAGGLYSEEGWAQIWKALTRSHYDELTLLRLRDVVESPVARREVARITAPSNGTSRP